MPGVVIDCFPEAAAFHREGAIVAVDVFRATTTAVTAAAAGYRVFVVPSLELAVPLAARLDRPLLVGELGGSMPYGFDLNNSPAEIAARTDAGRSIILLSTSGTRLIAEGMGAEAVYPGCLRNVHALAEHLATAHERVAVIGAGARSEFREEDQLCAAWIADGLVARGFEIADARTAELVERWRGAAVEEMLISNSVRYLQETGQVHDLEFVLAHIDDVDAVWEVREGELVPVR